MVVVRGAQSSPVWRSDGFFFWRLSLKKKIKIKLKSKLRKVEATLGYNRALLFEPQQTRWFNM